MDHYKEIELKKNEEVREYKQFCLKSSCFAEYEKGEATLMDDISINRGHYLNILEEELTHFIGIVTSVDIMPDKRIRIRLSHSTHFNNYHLFAANNGVIDCFLPPINSKEVVPYQNMLRWIGENLPIYEDNSFHLVDLKGASVIATVKLRYVSKKKRYKTKLTNLIILSLDQQFL